MQGEQVSEAREQSKTERVHGLLRRRIRELVLPPGAALREEEIAAELAVSRAPVSEAIARLAEEGLVEVFPQHGSFVAPIRAAEVREALFIRTALETEALDRDDLSRFHDLDEALHALLFAAVESPRAMRFLDAARAPLDRVRRLALPEPGRPQATLAEHCRLVDAVRSGDPEFAAAAMRVHLTMVARSVERELAKLDAQPKAPAT